MTAPDPPADLIDTDAARAILGDVNRDVLDDLVVRGHLTQYRISPRVIRYSRAEVAGYLAKAAAAGAEECKRKHARRKGA